MTYQQTIDYLFAATPQFEQQGGSAYKPGLERVLAMAEAIGSPHLGTGVRYIHVAGTNGKGSTSSTLAAICRQPAIGRGFLHLLILWTLESAFVLMVCLLRSVPWWIL